MAFIEKEKENSASWNFKLLRCQGKVLVTTMTLSSLQVLSTLGTEQTAVSTAAQCVACIAAAELPSNQWPELISTLVGNVSNASSEEVAKSATLEAIGYMCEDMPSEVSLCTQC